MYVALKAVVDVVDEDKDQFWRVLDDELRLGLYQWRRGQPYELDPIEWLGGGSESLVAVVARPGPGYGDQVIFKFARTSEVNNWQEAISNCPEKFRTQHLVNMVAPAPITKGANNWWLAVLKIAGGDASTFRPLIESHPNKGRSFAGMCKKIVKSIISEWNPAPRFHSPVNISRASCLSEIFDSKRVTPGKPLGEWLDLNNVDCTNPLIRRPEWSGHFPNPLTFAAEASQFGKGEQRGVLYGRAHGDLHLRNILLPTNPVRPNQYKLIDLGGYSSKAPLARDPMHLLLSIALEWLNSGVTAGSQTSRSLAEVIVRPRMNTIEKECQEVSLAIHNAGYEWASQEGWGKEWTQQSLLFLVGCALRYASRALPESKDLNATRGWFFDVAALAARAYLEEAGIWDHYMEAYSPGSHGSSTRNEQQIVSQISDRFPADAVPSSEGESVTDAKILSFHRYSELDLAKNRKASRQHSNEEGSWEDLTHALREAAFDDQDWETMAARIGPLLEQIGRTRLPHPAYDREIQDHLKRLEIILTRALKSQTSTSELRSAATQVNIIRDWLLDLLIEQE